MTFIKHEDRERRNAIWPNNHLWPGGIVPYDISPEYNCKLLLEASLYYINFHMIHVLGVYLYNIMLAHS